MNETIRVNAAKKLLGTINIPGDKSVSHRSVILSSLADTPVTVKNFLHSQDCWSTVNCLRLLGTDVKQNEQGDILICGKGMRSLSEPKDILDAGNSGTTMRLLLGVLAAQPFFSVLTGDDSLRSRPMSRVIGPLTQMGAKISARENSRFAPIVVNPSGGLHGIDYVSPVASAQIKSCILLATLASGCTSSVTEPIVSRDHTERMLQAFGVDIHREKTKVTIKPAERLVAPPEIEVPGDISSAAFWLVAATIIPDSKLTLKNVGINPTRSGIIDVLLRMGADLKLHNERLSGYEPVADITVCHANLKGINIEPEIIPRLIDELPVLAVAALFADGVTSVTGAGELRVKETDRLSAVSQEVGKLGGFIAETPDGFSIEGRQKLTCAQVDSYHDHRMAMAMAIAGLAGGGADIIGPDCVKISYPDFFDQIDKLRS